LSSLGENGFFSTLSNFPVIREGSGVLRPPTSRRPAGPTPNSYRVCPVYILPTFQSLYASFADGEVSVRFTVWGLTCLGATTAPILHTVAWNLIMYMRKRCRIPCRCGAGQFSRSSPPQDPRGGEIRGGEGLYFPVGNCPLRERIGMVLATPSREGWCSPWPFRFGSGLPRSRLRVPPPRLPCVLVELLDSAGLAGFSGKGAAELAG